MQEIPLALNMAIILDGKKLSQEILGDLKRKIKKSGKRLKLAAVLVGKDKNSLIFLRQKEKACKFVGVDFKLYQFPENINQEILKKEVKKIGSFKNHGIIIQLPLPKHIDAEKILTLIPADKDIDVLSGKEIKAGILAPVLVGILALMEEYKINFRNKKFFVAGAGRLVGKPATEWLKKHRFKISDDIGKADVIISGVGKPGFIITGDMIKKGAVVVDAAGDVDFKSASLEAAYITPIPGGVGPMTVAMIIKNLTILNKC